MSDSILRWPDWMPKPQKNGYSMESVDRRTKTEMEIGAVTRVEFDTDENTINCTLILNRIQVQWFESFEQHVLHQGSTWFELPIWDSGAVKYYRVRMKNRPKYGNLIGLHTTVTLALDVGQRELLCGGIAQLLLCFSPEQIQGLASSLHKTLHSDAVNVTKIPDFWLYKGCIRRRIAYEYGQ